MNQEVSLASLSKTELYTYSATHNDKELFKAYLSLSKEEQLAVYSNLGPEKQAMIWKEHDLVEKRKTNPLVGLEGDELEEAYFSLSKDQQLKAYEQLDDKQKAHVWTIFEKQKQGNAEASKPKTESPRGDDQVQTIMRLQPGARKNLLATYSDENLVEFYKKVTIQKDQMQIWQELDNRQQQVILAAAEIHKKEQALKKMEGRCL